MSSAISFKLDQSKILSSGNGLTNLIQRFAWEKVRLFAGIQTGPPAGIFRQFRLILYHTTSFWT